MDMLWGVMLKDGTFYACEWEDDLNRPAGSPPAPRPRIKLGDVVWTGWYKKEDEAVLKEALNNGLV